MKKIISITLILILTSLLIGCGGSSEYEDTGSCSIIVKINDTLEEGIIVNLGTDYSGVTDSTGIAHIFGIDPGTYNITLIRNDITIETGETIKIQKDKLSSKMISIII